MAEPLPPAETIDESRALRHAPPFETPEEARRRVVERMCHQAAAKHRNGSGNGKAKRLNGKNGHAPAAPAPDPVNWAQVIGQQAAEIELRHEQRLQKVKEYTVALFAKSGGLRESDLTALAKGLVPFLNEMLAETAAPLNARIDEIESVVRSLVEWRARNGG